MIFKEIQAKSLLRKQKKIDSWFLSRYNMNLYRGCLHACAYCDGRAEKYFVEEAFGREVAVKVSAVDILRKELDPQGKRTAFTPSYIFVGGGVCDSYGPAEEKYGLTRRVLELLAERQWPVHLLTKSGDVQRDWEILLRIQKQKGALVSFSFSSIDPAISALFEPHAPSPAQRLEAMAFLKSKGLNVGMMLMPVIPFITDAPGLLEGAVRKAKEAGASYVLCSSMTLKPGRQKDHFYTVLEKHYPDLLPVYAMLYPENNAYGAAIPDYFPAVYELFQQIVKKYNMPQRIPPRFFRRILTENDYVTVLLEHMDYVHKSLGRRSPFGYAAYSISQVAQPLSTMRSEIGKIKGVGKMTEKVVREIMETGMARDYERLLGG
ncbi:MAG: radical SAM protein [Desulfobacteraceae bacterium]|nr:MAG: radical SAM protein [Desulfobacteraceae bacterium]